MLLAAAIPLAACGTARSSPPTLTAGACPVTYVEYPEKVRLQAAAEYERLPDGGLRVLIDDYKVVRAEVRSICGEQDNGTATD